MRSKVVKAEYKRSWTTKDGTKTYFSFDIEFENGDAGEYSSISEQQKFFVPGQEAEYEVDTSNPKYPKIKPVRQFGGGGKPFQPAGRGDQSLEIASKTVNTALMQATELVKSGHVKPDQLIASATKMLGWLLESLKGAHGLLGKLSAPSAPQGNPARQETKPEHKPEPKPRAPVDEPPPEREPGQDDPSFEPPF